MANIFEVNGDLSKLKTTLIYKDNSAHDVSVKSISYKKGKDSGNIYKQYKFTVKYSTIGSNISMGDKAMMVLSIEGENPTSFPVSSSKLTFSTVCWGSQRMKKDNPVQKIMEEI